MFPTVLWCLRESGLSLISVNSSQNSWCWSLGIQPRSTCCPTKCKYCGARTVPGVFASLTFPYPLVVIHSLFIGCGHIEKTRSSGIWSFHFHPPTNKQEQQLTFIKLLLCPRLCSESCVWIILTVILRGMQSHSSEHFIKEIEAQGG